MATLSVLAVLAIFCRISCGFIVKTDADRILEGKISRFTGVGYNLLYGDPDSDQGSGVDPGYKPTRKIIELHNSVDSSVIITVGRNACLSRSSLVVDEKSYQKKFDENLKVSTSIGFSNAVFGARFSLSSGYRKSKETLERKNEVVVEESAECNMGRGRVQLALDTVRLTREFEAAVCSLPATYSQSEYMDFIDAWGTHVTSQVDIGTKRLHRKTAKLSSFFEHAITQSHLETSASASYLSLVSASISMDLAKFRMNENFVSSLHASELVKVIGTAQNPEPIGVVLTDISQFLQPRYFRDSLAVGCDGGALDHLEDSRSALQQALQAYPAYKHAGTPHGKSVLTLPLTWPKGTYGLMKASSGCPGGPHVTWKEGSRHWDTEDSDASNSVTGGHHLAGSIGHDIDLSFCMKTATEVSANDMNWPPGEYCLLKYRNCPDGFQVGSLYFDDEDSNNKNSASGTLPDGSYNANTQLYFCCRKDGDPKHPIYLPVDHPFFLIKATRYECQDVIGMTVREESVHWDNEDFNNNDGSSGASPFDSDRSYNTRLHFCYYEKSAHGAQPLFG